MRPRVAVRALKLFFEISNEDAVTALDALHQLAQTPPSVRNFELIIISTVAAAAED